MALAGFLSHNRTNTQLCVLLHVDTAGRGRGRGLLSTWKWQYLERSTLLFLLLALRTLAVGEGFLYRWADSRPHQLLPRESVSDSGPHWKSWWEMPQTPLSQTSISEGGFQCRQHSPPAAITPTQTSPQARCVLADFQREGKGVWGTPGYWYEAQWWKAFPICRLLTP